MKKLVVLAALAFALGTVHQASACDFGAHAANATPVVVASATDQSPTQPAAAKPDEATAPQVTTTDKPAAPPATVADSN
jgi:hypothetical protein